ncbi:penicillin-binding transpeptidase domain-containing protein [Ruegeria sp. 2205SS24-7]|uniref:penicillin-binding transpeptidase domain-containing protein n=1 Tax=Ruegeria discodermiae TaxID=3064389 RepID=UPI002741BBD4|nr:penicillin-binding transpeptidase domain-containing protein [Ruegeria sp. 2205SS24-7]MDP5220598.1 penicillin-binding transpeptidase domain-containing protein [Ruegeria sp. 2205SS24-7]
MDLAHLGKNTKSSAKATLLRGLCGIGLAAFVLTSQVAAEALDVGRNLEAAGGEIESSTIVIKRLSDGQYWIASPDRARRRYSPASTSKIPHSLIALENGLATSETVFQWDNVPRSNRAWNQDHSLESAFQNSVVWAYQEIARNGGQAVMANSLKSFEYGNADVGTIDQLATYWLDGTLTITALEQVEFLSKLALKLLPLSETTYAAARDIMVTDTHADWTMRSKTGWRYSTTDMDIGWFVGWLECASDSYVFALNMDMPDTRFLSKRKAVMYHILQDIGAFNCG